MNPAIIIGIVVVVIIIAVGAYFTLRSGDESPAPEPGTDAPAETGDINSVLDDQIDEIANDVANAAKEGYIARREYMTPSPKQSVKDFTKIVLKNIVGKPVRAVVSRDDVSGVLKVVMTGVNPSVFEPSISSISDCVSDKIKTSTGGPRNIPTYAYDCTNDYFSTNGSEFRDKIAPAALTMYENAFNKYAPDHEKEKAKSDGGLKKIMACNMNNIGKESDFVECINGSEIPKITWENVKPIIARFKPSTGPTPEGMQPIN